ncbi:MAG: glycosyltransferase family 2 protein [Chitinophagales bacterium]|nr:glycosyltransferase family 2 protein [Chitinophagales bacterium]
MKLSVVIVSYNVRYFLELCLQSVERAIRGIPAEVFVVDNNSSDQSAETVRLNYPWVKLIANDQNLGFAKANNQAIRQSTGEYVLLLNPDTVVAEDTFTKCIAFMDSHPDAGGMGVRMIDGTGRFLPESKRGLPTPAVAFFKMFGLSALFPRSRVFGKYHLGYLSETDTYQVDVLSGAFMFLRRSVLNQTGLLDEDFFMYGEDIDLSYRITKAGYKNYYFPHTTIIHFKGESTKKGTLNYVKIFYQAMIIFARKHFSGNQSVMFSLLIDIAVVARAVITLISGLLTSSYLPLIDAGLSYTGIFLIANYWEQMIKYQSHYYPMQFFMIVVPAYVVVWLLTSYLSGAYDKPFRTSSVIRGVITGTIVIAVLYAFLPNSWRFSRAIILLGAAWTGLQMLATRYAHRLLSNNNAYSPGANHRAMLAVADREATRIHKLLHTFGYHTELVTERDISRTHLSAALHRCGEVIFSTADYSFADIIGQFNAAPKVQYKILPQGTEALVGSHSKNTAGDLYVAERSYRLFRPRYQRLKRILDVSLCIFMLFTMPFHLLFIKPRSKFITNWWQVLINRKWWVGPNLLLSDVRFRAARPAVLSPFFPAKYRLSEDDERTFQIQYARYYSLADDLLTLWYKYRQLGE